MVNIINHIIFITKAKTMSIADPSHIDLTVPIIMLAAAVLVTSVVQRLHASAIVGYLLAGLIIGPAGFGWIQNTPTTQFLADLGVVFLLFAVGLELPLERLRVMRHLVFGFRSVVGDYSHHQSRPRGNRAIFVDRVRQGVGGVGGDYVFGAFGIASILPHCHRQSQSRVIYRYDLVGRVGVIAKHISFWIVDGAGRVFGGCNFVRNRIPSSNRRRYRTIPRASFGAVFYDRGNDD
ncbi:MAG: hypothetical protein EBV03_11085 [Proteobacteria bacterium]|nr:hypothetical protein [Pseudomonadota bacterium]